jgi:arylformamidase
MGREAPVFRIVPGVIMTRSQRPDQLIDISILVNEFTPEWPGDTPFSCQWTWEMARGESVNVSCINSSPHVGTHADAPFHVDPRWPTSEALPLEAFSGPDTVVDVTNHHDAIVMGSLGDVATRPVERLLLRTGRTVADGPFPDGWPWLDDATAQELVDRGLRLLGVDAPSVDARDTRTLSVHRILFKGGASILENLDLRSAPPGDYHLTAFPLRLAGLDAAPVRAVLRPLPPA